MRTLLNLGFIALLVLGLASQANALQLTWSTGSPALTLAAAGRCTLVVQNEPGAVFPAEWRLHWVTSECTVSAASADPQAAPVGTAWPCGLDRPSRPSELAANQTTAHYCSDGGSVTSALVILDVSAPGRGKFQVFALDPANSNVVLQSNEATLNGGVAASFPPAVLHVDYAHDATGLQVAITGAGLDTVHALKLTGANDDWDLPLSSESRTSTRVAASVNAVAPVPDCALNVVSSNGIVGTAAVPAEPPPQTVDMSGYVTFFDPSPDFYPKDHAFVYAAGRYHILYTRGSHSAATDGKTFGHATSIDLQNWTVDNTNVMPVRDGAHGAGLNWDFDGVWAPHIVKEPGSMIYTMFYTGVTSPATNNVQKIGIAQSTDLVNWTRRDDPILDPTMAPWASHDPTFSNGEIFPGRQCRDPFVMPDPLNPGKWLMYFSAVRATDNSYVVGVARTDNLTGFVASWSVLTNPLAHTDLIHQHQAVNQRVESPHVFQAQGKWWLAFTMAGDANGFLRLSENPIKPYDESPAEVANWNHMAWNSIASGYYNYGLPLQVFLGDPAVHNWFASEYLRVPGDDWPLATQREYMTACDGNKLYVSQMYWPDNDHFTLSVPVSGTSSEGGPKALAMRLLGFRPGVGTVNFAIDLPSTSHVRLSIYDTAGRRVRTVLDTNAPAGTAHGTWDGWLETGGRAASGVYFARLESALGGRPARASGALTTSAAHGPST